MNLVARDLRLDSDSVVLDNTVFINCVFNNCTFEYKGGGPPSMFRCAIVQPGGQYIDAKGFIEKNFGGAIPGEDRFASSPTTLIIWLKSWEVDDQLIGSGSEALDEAYLISTVCYDLFVDGNGIWISC